MPDVRAGLAGRGPSRAPRNGRLALGGAALTGFVALAHGVNDVFTSMLTALLPSLQLRFGLGEATLALLVATFTFGSSLPQPLLGALSDRLSPRIMAAAGLGLSAIVLSLIGVAGSTPLLFLLILVGGLGSAALHPAGSLLMRHADERRAERAAGFFAAAGMVGFALGPIAILAIVARFGLDATVWLMVPGLALAAATLVLVSDRQRPHAAKPRFDRRLLAGPIGYLTLAGALSHLPFLGFLSAAPLWLVNARGFAPDAAMIGWTLALFSLASAVGAASGGWLGARLGRASVSAGSMLLSLIPLFAIFALDPGSTAYLAAVIAAGALSYMALPLLVASAQDLAPQAIAAASGMVIGLSAGLAGLLYVAAGWLQEAIGLEAAMSATYVAMLPAAALTFAVLRRHAGTLAQSQHRASFSQLPCGCRHGAVPVRPFAADIPFSTNQSGAQP